MKYFISSLLQTSYCDYAYENQVGFQDPATPIMEGIVDLHHELFFYLIVILVLVSWIFVRVLWIFGNPMRKKISKFTHKVSLEIMWTIVPAIVLGFMSMPSFGLLYSISSFIDPLITIKVIGHQWYWSYEYSDFKKATGNSISFDSYMVPEDELEMGTDRLLEVDNSVFVPAHSHIRLIITSTDVIHSWAIPSFGVKADAVPGRLNEVSFFTQREGSFSGQCSELCGVNHAFMPIRVESVNTDVFSNEVYAYCT